VLEEVVVKKRPKVTEMVPTGEWEVNLETDFSTIYSHITTTATP
jgi:hypothetical protein